LYLLDHPDIADQIPDGALVVFVPAFYKGLARRDLLGCWTPHDPITLVDILALRVATE